MAKSKPIIRITQLNNKSRNGAYVYVKQKGKQSRYYKYDPEAPLDAYLKYYLDSNRVYRGKKVAKGTIRDYEKAFKKQDKRRKKASHTTKRVDEYLREIKKRPTINKAIQRGMTRAEIINAEMAGTNRIKKAKEDLLRPLVLDQSLLEILIKEENFKKLKFRLEHQIQFIDKQGNSLASTTIFNKTIDEVIRDLKEVTVKGERLNPQDASKSRLAQRIKWKQYQALNVFRSGFVSGAKLVTVFRKGK